jgi:hypothetical protein
MFAFNSKNHFKVDLRGIHQVIFQVQNLSEEEREKRPISVDKTFR